MNPVHQFSRVGPVELWKPTQTIVSSFTTRHVYRSHLEVLDLFSFYSSPRQLALTFLRHSWRCHISIFFADWSPPHRNYCSEAAGPGRPEDKKNLLRRYLAFLVFYTQELRVWDYIPPTQELRDYHYFSPTEELRDHHYISPTEDSMFWT